MLLCLCHISTTRAIIVSVCQVRGVGLEPTHSAELPELQPKLQLVPYWVFPRRLALIGKLAQHHEVLKIWMPSL